MSYFEYFDMYQKCQQNGSDKILLVIDVVNSKNNDLYVNQRKRIFDMMFDVVKNIPFEIKCDNKLLFKDDKKFFVLGDLFAITIRADKNIDDVICLYKELIRKMKHRHDISLKFHIGGCYYETDDYCDGGIKYYSGYAIQQVERLIKNNKDII